MEIVLAEMVLAYGKVLYWFLVRMGALALSHRKQEKSGSGMWAVLS